MQAIGNPLEHFDLILSGDHSNGQHLGKIEDKGGEKRLGHVKGRVQPLGLFIEGGTACFAQEPLFEQGDDGPTLSMGDVSHGLFTFRAFYDTVV